MVNTIKQVIDISEEKKLALEVEALIELYDFMKSNPDLEIGEIAKFMPPIDTRVVKMAIHALSVRDSRENKKMVK